MTFEGSRVYILLVLSVSLVIFLAAGQKESPNLGVEWEKGEDIQVTVSHTVYYICGTTMFFAETTNCAVQQTDGYGRRSW